MVYRARDPVAPNTLTCVEYCRSKSSSPSSTDFGLLGTPSLLWRGLAYFRHSCYYYCCLGATGAAAAAAVVNSSGLILKQLRPARRTTGSEVGTSRTVELYKAAALPTCL